MSRKKAVKENPGIYVLASNPIIEYYLWIEENRTDVCDKIYRVYKELVRLINDPLSEYEYSKEKASHAIEFIQRYCKHSKGKMGGKPFILELWQLALVAATFGIVHKIDGTRKFTEVLLVVARKNGKSTLAAAIGLYLQVADGEPGAEVFACATKKDQAKIIWLEAKRMVKKSPVLLKRIKPLVAEMVADFNDSFFKPLGSDSETLDGLNVHGALLDEIHAWKTKDLYDVIVDGTSARDQPLIFITTTAGTVRESIYDIKYDEAEQTINGYADPSPDAVKNERFLPIIYELDSRAEWSNKANWKKANPGLGSIKKTDQLAEKVKKALINSMLVKNLLCKDFNIRETSSEAWLTFEDIYNPEKFDISVLTPKYGIGGADLSITTDLTAAKVIFMVPGDPRVYVLQMYWLPEDILEKRAEEDKIPYDTWRDNGLLRTCPGNSIDPTYVTAWFKEVMYDLGVYIPWIGYDRYSAKYWVEEMKLTFGSESMIPVAQGKQTLSGPMHKLGADLKANKVIYNNNPIDKWCLTNTSIDIDKNLNIQPCKTKNQRRRIDGTAALLNAYVVLQEKLQDYMTMI